MINNLEEKVKKQEMTKEQAQALAIYLLRNTKYASDEYVWVASKDEKVGIAVGVTEKLTEKYNAVNFVKAGSEIIGGKGGGGRKDFAQAGGQDESKIDQAFESIKKLI